MPMVIGVCGRLHSWYAHIRCVRTGSCDRGGGQGVRRGYASSLTTCGLQLFRMRARTAERKAVEHGGRQLCCAVGLPL